jgi:hypothetical protein
MAYPSDNWTDKELEALEKRIAQVFKEAEKDLDKEVKAYFAKFKLRDKEMQARVEAGVMTKAEYQQWRLTQIGRGQRFEALRDRVAERYTQANEVANAYVNDMTPSIYSLNRNYEAYNIEKTVGSCDFTMWDESTVRRLLVEQPDLMPYYPPSRALNRGIDLAYGKDQITKHVTSGIIRGLAPGKIANELMANLTGMNRASAVRAARTGITAAQNAGRMDSYVAAEKMGIQIRRRWICTKDSRTRLDHGMADGQIVVGTKKPFKVGGYKMMFPGDSSLGAPGHEIYNCRCTTRTVEKDGIEAEPRQMRVANPEYEKARAEENKLSAKVDKLKGKEQAATDPEQRKKLRSERIAAQKELSTATKKRQGLDKDVVVNEMTYSEWKKWKKGLENPVNGSIMGTERGMASGARKSYLIRLSEKDKQFILQEIDAIGADRSVFVFRDGQPTVYVDSRDKIFVSSSVFPSEDDSTHPTDRLSVRATLAHEYYGHRAHRNTKVKEGAWNDEFRASYLAAKNCPGLTDQDRALLINDAMQRAKDAGVNIRLNSFMRRCLYGIE